MKDLWLILTLLTFNQLDRMKTKEEQLEIELEYAKRQLLTDDWMTFKETKRVWRDITYYRLSREYWMDAYLDIEIYEDEVKWYLQAKLWDGTRWPVYMRKRDNTFALNYWDIQWELEGKAYDRDIFKSKHLF